MIVNSDYILVADLGDTGLVTAVVEVKAPSSLEFVTVPTVLEEAQLGFYNFAVPKSLITDLGTYIFRITTYEGEFIEKRECLPSPLVAAPAPDICIVTGNVLTASGNSENLRQILIEVYPVKLPSVANSNYILGRSVIGYTDYSGFFQLPLVIGMTAIIEIKEAGIRFQAIIPDQPTISIDDLMP